MSPSLDVTLVSKPFKVAAVAVIPSRVLSSAVVAVTPSKRFNSTADAVTVATLFKSLTEPVKPSSLLISVAVEVTPSSMLSSAVVEVTPSNKFNSVAVAVTASNLFKSFTSPVKPSSLLISAGVAVIATPPTLSEPVLTEDGLMPNSNIELSVCFVYCLLSAVLTAISPTSKSEAIGTLAAMEDFLDMIFVGILLSCFGCAIKFIKGST